MLGALVAALLLAGVALAAGWRWRRRAAALARQLEAAARSLEAMQQAFSRFAPEQVVEQIIARGIDTSSEKKDVTVLFADLKGFTAMSADMDPALLVRILNGYLQRMSRAITGRGGHVSKFLGDGILALFGALEPNPWQTNDAVHAALAMQAALVEYNASLAAEGLPRLAVGVGIHRGPVVAGVIGSADLKEYTVIGATVNLASRIESLTRTHGVDVLITEPVREALDPRFLLRSMPPTPVKGLAEPVGTYAVDGFAEEAGSRPAPG